MLQEHSTGTTPCQPDSSVPLVMEAWTLWKHDDSFWIETVRAEYVESYPLDTSDSDYVVVVCFVHGWD
jgi:hypothetical protein